jgi:RNA polymerase sigma-70 factor (ECF subfamily)
MHGDARTDEQLVADVNGGDASAFQALYDRYRDWVFNLALRVTRDHALAGDVMQETFLYLLRKFPRFTLTAQLKTFLYPVVRHTALAMQRSAKRAAGEGPAQDSAPKASSDEARLAALGDALNQLEPGQREVLILRFVDELSLQEIALAMEIPLGTVKSRLHHALKLLRADRRLKEFFESP